ncbi:MAG: hypothetical protein LUE10_00135, partial [Alistipes sp.]|nr:hypothetical protein [Alistipes sp.]
TGPITIYKPDMDTDNINNGPRRSYIRRHLGGFFLLAAIAGVGLAVYGYMPKYPSRYLYERSISYPDYRQADTTTVEPDAELSWMIELAGSLYADRDFGGAALVYDKLFASYPAEELPEQVFFYSGMSCLLSGDPDGAIKLFGSIPRTGSVFSDDMRWFLALAHLVKSENLAARLILEDISGEEDNPYAGRARELVGMIKTKRWF